FLRWGYVSGDGSDTGGFSGDGSVPVTDGFWRYSPSRLLWWVAVCLDLCGVHYDRQSFLLSQKVWFSKGSGDVSVLHQLNIGLVCYPPMRVFDLCC
ncbi:hypothetical protein A2U01_0014718, partial [Trifolium medium]|nr:hypothetical protein [Trifolium medium]